jgi:hypothetical protein
VKRIKYCGCGVSYTKLQKHALKGKQSGMLIKGEKINKNKIFFLLSNKASLKWRLKIFQSSNKNKINNRFKGLMLSN